VSWNPAVPPPPVTGAAGGTLLAGEAVTVFVTVAAGTAALELTPGVPDAEVAWDEAEVAWDEAELPEDAEPPGEAEVPEEAELPDDAVDGLMTDGEKIGVLLDEDEVHAETATGASSVRAPQPRTVSVAPNVVPAVIPRTFMDPPHAPGS